MRSLAPDMDPDVVTEIDARLARASVEHHVSIPWAIESGSRAWGFPSPDSDYDGRFLFVRPLADYASPWRHRDVVETPLDATYDVGGWDLIKAVRLVVAGNATVGEWLRSPLVYSGEAGFRDDLLDLVERVADRAAVARHYLHVGRQQWHSSGADDGDDVSLKQLFYALRPAAALHWLSGHDHVSPPMNLHQLLAEAPPDQEVMEAVDQLVAAKRVTREIGRGRVPAPIRRFVTAELDGAEDRFPRSREPRAAAVREDATSTFLLLVDRWGPV